MLAWAGITNIDMVSNGLVEPFVYGDIFHLISMCVCRRGESRFSLRQLEGLSYSLLTL